MPRDIHPLVQDADDDDLIIAFAVDDEVGAMREVEIAGANMSNRSAPPRTLCESLDRRYQVRMISIRLSA